MQIKVAKYVHLWSQTTDNVHWMGSFLFSSSFWALLLGIIIIIVPIKKVAIIKIQEGNPPSFSKDDFISCI